MQVAPSRMREVSMLLSQAREYAVHAAIHGQTRFYAVDQDRCQRSRGKLHAADRTRCDIEQTVVALTEQPACAELRELARVDPLALARPIMNGRKKTNQVACLFGYVVALRQAQRNDDLALLLLVQAVCDRRQEASHAAFQRVVRVKGDRQLARDYRDGRRVARAWRH